MPEIGVRELKTHASEIVRTVRDEHARYVVTYRGRPVGVLLPLDETEVDPDEEAAAWEELVALGEEIGQGWQSPLSSAELLSEMRR
jgi:prevent-host-death family protein